MPAPRAPAGRPPVRLATLVAGLVMAGLACNPNTLRPPFGPLPQAVELELELAMGYAVEVTAEALRLDSIPVTVVHARDGYLETDWFESRTGEPSSARPLGVEMVRVRGWATPGRVGHTDLIIEAVYRPLADPSRPARDLERLVSPDHPVARRLEVAVRKLIEQFGDPDQLVIPEPPPPPARDTTVRPDTTVGPDTTARPDTTTRPDTIVRPRLDTLSSRPRDPEMARPQGGLYLVWTPAYARGGLASVAVSAPRPVRMFWPPPPDEVADTCGQVRS